MYRKDIKSVSLQELTKRVEELNIEINEIKSEIDRRTTRNNIEENELQLDNEGRILSEGDKVQILTKGRYRSRIGTITGFTKHRVVLLD